MKRAKKVQRVKRVKSEESEESEERPYTLRSIVMLSSDMLSVFMTPVQERKKHCRKVLKRKTGGKK